MKTELTFSETQKFKQWWVWALILIIDAFILLSIYNLIKNDSQSIFGTSNGIVFIILLFVLFVLNFFLLFLKLEYTIDQNGIKIRMFPILIKFKRLSWNEIDKCYVRKYQPIAEYGGWGYRIGIFGSGKAYNIKGNMGLQLEFKDGKKLLIGTQKAEELKEYLMKIEKYFE